jgi:hypothetical protein
MLVQKLILFVYNLGLQVGLGIRLGLEIEKDLINTFILIKGYGRSFKNK